MSKLSIDDLGGWKAILTTVTAGQDLTAVQAATAMREILEGRATPAQIAGFLVGLRMKGEAVVEVSAMVDEMLEASAPIELGDQAAAAIDIVGTGGSPTRRIHALNVSTMACFVAAGAGATICKHGNRRASSTSGSFDMLEALGVPVELGGDEVARSVRSAQMGFCYAPAFHPAMRHAGPVRAELGVLTVFNFIGPLSNPARVVRQVIGVSNPGFAPTVIGVLQDRGAPRAMVVHGHDGMDELTITGPSTVYELEGSVVRTYEFNPSDVGIEVVDASQVRGGDPSDNARIARAVLDGEPGPYRDIVTINAAAGLWVSGMADSLAEGLAMAGASIDEGRAAEALARVVSLDR